MSADRVPCTSGGRLNRFNVVKQSKDYDTEGRYLRAWIPELASCPDEHIHEPWLMPPTLQVGTSSEPSAHNALVDMMPKLLCPAAPTTGRS